MPPVLIVSRDRVELAERVAITVASFVLEKPNACIALTVGATPSLSYRHISSFAVRGVIDLSKNHFVVWDEFYSSTDQLRSSPHLHQLSKLFFNPSNILPSKIVHPESMGIQQSLSSFSELMLVRPPNLIILGLGPNGSIGWISTTDGASKGVHSLSIGDANDQNHGYQECISLGMDQIMQANQVLLLAQARNKAQLVSTIMKDTKGTTPAAYILHNHPHIKFFVDGKAASALSSKLTPSLNLKGFVIINDPEIITNKKIICFSPHPDDTSISAGASLSFLAQNNTVISCCATTGHRAYIPETNRDQRIAIRKKEATNEARHIDAIAHFLDLPLYDRASVCSDEDISIVVEYILKQMPDIIFLPHTGDAHPTHCAVLRAILQALCTILTTEKQMKFDLFMYEGPWSLFTKGSYNTIISTPPEHHAKKIAAIRAHKSQTDRTPYDVAGNALSQLRGALVPEQDLAGFGGDPPKLAEKLELFFNITVETPIEVQKLISLLDEGNPPTTAVGARQNQSLRSSSNC